MTTRDTAFAPGTPCWVDLMTGDIDRAKDFYAEVLGWTYEPSSEEFGGYTTAQSDGHRVAGLMPKSPGMEHPDVWSTYLSTADIAATEAAATAAGATVVQGAMPVGDLGSMSVLTGPDGATFGLWQAGTHTGFGKYNEPGSVTWDEVNSRDFTASVAFYETVFGWSIDKMSDTDEMRYYLGQLDGWTVAAVADAGAWLPPGVPSHWAVYFAVADTDEALATVQRLGGSVLRPAEDTPYGRMADVTDPNGASLKLISEKLLDPSIAQSAPA